MLVSGIDMIRNESCYITPNGNDTLLLDRSSGKLCERVKTGRWIDNDGIHREEKRSDSIKGNEENSPGPGGVGRMEQDSTLMKATLTRRGRLELLAR